MHILSPETDNCSSWISRRLRENDCRKYFMINLHKRIMPIWRGSNPQPPDHQFGAHPTVPTRPASSALLNQRALKIKLWEAYTSKDDQKGENIFCLTEFSRLSKISSYCFLVCIYEINLKDISYSVINCSKYTIKVASIGLSDIKLKNIDPLNFMCMVNVLKFRTLYSIHFWPKFCFLCSCFIKY